jgi:UDP-GlcNAc:undecaprenyl-phosphate/decaprenyl-phosphate GlcNAc-1-phosphate transferase
VKSYMVVFVVAMGVTFVATPLVRTIAARLGAVDVPDDRKVHTTPTPTLGGLAIFAGVVAGLATALLIADFRELFQTSSEPVGVLAAAVAMVGLGALDDVRNLRASTKLAGQVVATGALILAGVQVFYFWLPGAGLISLSPDMSALLTVVWTVLLVNAMNLIDGLDGLAAGVSAIAAAALFVYAYRSGGGLPSTAGLFAALVVGACLGFLPHNFNPARIFMGDSGSMLIGMLLASSTVSGVGRTIEPNLSDVAGLVVPVLLPFFVLAIPLADTGFAVLRRIRDRRPLAMPDKRHIHHWLFDMAGSHRQAVLVMYLWAAMLASSALTLSLIAGRAGRVVGLSIAGALVVSIVVVPRVLRRGTAWDEHALRERIHNVPGEAGQT